MKRDITENFKDILDEAEQMFDGAAPLSEAERTEGRRRVRAWRSQMEEPCRVAVVGVVSSGKSTFVNALLEHDWAKEGASVVTGTICVMTNHDSLVYGKPISCHYRESTRRPEWLSMKEAHELQSDAPEARSRAGQIEYLEYAMGHHTAPLLLDFELVDTPGINAIVDDDTSTDGKAHDRITFGFLEKADAIVLVANEYLAEKCLPLLSGYCKNCRHNMQQAASTIFIVASQVDSNCGNTMGGLIAKKKEREDNILREAMANFSMPETTKVIGVSAKLTNTLRHLGPQRFADLHRQVQAGNRHAVFEAVDMPMARLLISAMKEEDDPELLFRRLYDLSGIEEVKKVILQEMRRRKSILRAERIWQQVLRYFEWELNVMAEERREKLNGELDTISQFNKLIQAEQGFGQGTFGHDVQEFLQRFSAERYAEFDIRRRRIIARLQNIRTAVDYLQKQADTYNYFYATRNEFTPAETQEITNLCGQAMQAQATLTPDYIQARLGFWHRRATQCMQRRKRTFYQDIVKLYEGLRPAIQDTAP